jgi:hypothetical protein
MRLEVLQIFAEPVHPDAAHPLREPAQEADSFVSAQIESARATQVVEQHAELSLASLVVVWRFVVQLELGIG